MFDVSRTDLLLDDAVFTRDRGISVIPPGRHEPPGGIESEPSRQKRAAYQR